MSNYPDYTWPGDPYAPWNDYELPDCPLVDCEERNDCLDGCSLRYTCDTYLRIGDESC